MRARGFGSDCIPGDMFYFLSNISVRGIEIETVTDEEDTRFDTKFPWIVISRIVIDRTNGEFVAPVNYLLLGHGPTLAWYHGQNLGWIRRITT